MAGGTWTAQNKVRPGGYIDFQSVPAPSSNVGTRGIMTMPVPMTWGPADEIIKLYSTDLLDGSSLPKIGMNAFDPESLIYREALSSAYLALIYRIDTGGAKATASVETLEVSAKYAGTTGNKITVAVAVNTADNTLFDVTTYFDGAEKDRQTVAADAETLTNNDWVDFSLANEESLTPSAGVKLEGGENGTITPTTYASYLAAANQERWNTMAIPDDMASVKEQIVNYIKNKRDNTGRKCQAVLVDYANANYEGIISVEQGFVNLAGESITPTIFAATVAGLTASAEINQSRTYHEFTNADTIINPLKDEDVVAALQAGKFILTRKQSGAVIVEQDINTYHTFTPYKSRDFSKNRVIRVLDDIGNQALSMFENSYIGKVNNDSVGRSVLKGNIVSYIRELTEMEPAAVEDFDGANDVIVERGMDIEAVVADLWVKPIDAMEKLYLRVYVGGES